MEILDNLGRAPVWEVQLIERGTSSFRISTYTQTPISSIAELTLLAKTLRQTGISKQCKPISL